MASEHEWRYACWGVVGFSQNSVIWSESISPRFDYIFNYFYGSYRKIPVIQNTQGAAFFSLTLTIIAKVLISA